MAIFRDCFELGAFAYSFDSICFAVVLIAGVGENVAFYDYFAEGLRRERIEYAVVLIEVSGNIVVWLVGVEFGTHSAESDIQHAVARRLDFGIIALVGDVTVLVYEIGRCIGVVVTSEYDCYACFGK